MINDCLNHPLRQDSFNKLNSNKMFKLLFVFTLVLAASATAHQSTNNQTIVKSIAHWRLLPPIVQGHGRLVLFSVSDATLCPDCVQASQLLTKAQEFGAALQTVTVLCDYLPPGAPLCSTHGKFPHIAGYTWSDDIELPSVTDDQEGEEVADDLSPITLDFSSSSSANLTQISQWALGLANDESTSEKLVNYVSSAINKGDAVKTTLHTYTPSVKFVTAKNMENEIAKFDFSIVLLSTSECWKCANPLQQLEKLSRHLKNVHSATNVSIRRSAIDSNLRNELGIPDNIDVPIILIYSAKTLCGTSMDLAVNGKWARCAPIQYLGGTSFEDMLRYIQREFLTQEQGTTDYATITSYTPSLLSTQINSLENPKPSSHNIQSIFNSRSTPHDASSWLNRCKNSAEGCYLHMVSNWYLPVKNILQQQLNLFVGYSKINRIAGVKFAIADLATMPSTVFKVLAPELSGSQETIPVSHSCPNAACTFFISKSGVRLLPLIATPTDFDPNATTTTTTTENNEPQHLLTRGSRFYRIITDATSNEYKLPFPNTENKFLKIAQNNGNHIATLYVPKSVPKHAQYNQFLLRQVEAFEALCQSMNASINVNSGAGEVRCFVIDGNRNPITSNPKSFAFPTISFKKFGSEDIIDALAVVSGKHVPQYEAGINFLRNPSAFELSMCKHMNISCRSKKFIRHIKAGSFEATINDAEFAKFILFSGGPSCPHSPLLMETLERVARVHNRDRHEIIVAIIDATSELNADQRKLYDINTLPQIRFYPKGVQSLVNGVQIGEQYTGPSNAESMFEFIHFEMGYAFLDFDYRKDTSITSITGRNFEDEFVHEQSTNKSHSVLFLYDTVLTDRFVLDKLFRLDRQYFNNENISTPLTKKVDFFKMDGRRFQKLILKHHLRSVLDSANNQYPQLLFLPKGSKKLRKVVLYDRTKRFGAIDMAEFILKSISTFEKELQKIGNITSVFNFTEEDLREKSILDQDPLLTTTTDSHSNEPIVQSLTLMSFKDFVGSLGDRVVLFYTSTCQFCKSYKPHFEQAASHFIGDLGIKFGSINLDEHSEIGHVQGIQTIPAIKVYFEGSVDKSTEYRGEDFTGAKNNSEALINFITSVRRSPKVFELDQYRALRDSAIPTLENMTSLELLIGSPKIGSTDFIFETKGAEATVADKEIYLFDDKTYLPPVALSVTMDACGHCHHLSNVLIDVENYFLRSPLPRPKSIPQADAHIRFVKMDGTTTAAIAKRFGIEEFPVLILFYTKAYANGTMRHVSVKYNGVRNLRAVGDFFVKYLNTAVASEIVADDLQSQKPTQEAPVTPPLENPFEEEAVNQQQQFEEEEMNAVFNETIPVFSPRLLRTALIRTSVILIMTYSLPRDQPFVLVMNEMHNVLSQMPVVSKGMMSTAIFPEHLINDEVEELMGWSLKSQKPFITLIRGLARPQIVHFNKTTMKGVGDAPPPDSEDFFYDQPTPQLILSFLDKYARDVFVLPRNLNETTFMQNYNDLKNPKGKLSRWAVLMTEYDCKLCHKMIQSNSYSAQAQMVLHEPSIEVTVLDINRARKIYNQWGKPKLPALLLFERPTDPTDKGTYEIAFAKKLRIEEHEEGEEALVVPKRRQVHDFIMGSSTVPYDIIRPSMGFLVNGRAALNQASAKLSKVADEESLQAALGGDILKVGTASDLEHTLRQLTSPVIVVVKGDVCKTCSKIREAAVKTIIAAQSTHLVSLSSIRLVEVQLPSKSRQMERELITMGFAQLLTPSVYLVLKRPNQIKPVIVKFNGDKESADNILSFVLDTIPQN